MDGIVACGVDMIEIERLRRLCSRYGERFLRRVYGERERRLVAGRGDPGPFLAGRFAAKEAVLKVLGCGLFDGVRLTEIQILARESGEPVCELVGGAQRRARERGVGRVLVSISHCDAYAVAQAIGLGS